MVGVSRFELLTSRPPGVRATTAPNPVWLIIADLVAIVKIGIGWGFGCRQDGDLAGRKSPVWCGLMAGLET